MKKLLLGSSTLVAAMVAGPVMAADIARAPVYKAAPALPAPLALTWTGFYVGANCGGAWSRTQTVDVDGLFTWDAKDSGGFCGGQLGYNFQQDKAVFGFEGDLSLPWFKTAMQPSMGPTSRPARRSTVVRDVDRAARLHLRSIAVLCEGRRGRCSHQVLGVRGGSRRIFRNEQH